MNWFVAWPGCFRSGCDRVSVRAVRMTVRREQLWMVKRRRLRDRAWIRQAIAQEVHQVSLFLHGSPSSSMSGSMYLTSATVLKSPPRL